MPPPAISLKVKVSCIRTSEFPVHHHNTVLGQQHCCMGLWSISLTEPKVQMLLPLSPTQGDPAPACPLGSGHKPMCRLVPSSQFHIHSCTPAAAEEPQLLQTQQYLPGIEKLDITTLASSADLSFCYHLCLIIMQLLTGSWLS